MNNGGKLAGGNPARGRVENDFYATHPESVKALLEVEEIIYPAWEPACGEGHISKLLNGEVVSSDLIDRGYGEIADFLQTTEAKEINTIITNPPFNLFQEFVEQALKLTQRKVIMFGKLQALEGIKRATFLQKTPLRTVYVFKRRQQPMRDGKETGENGRKLSSTMAFAWFVWELGYTGKPMIEWI